MKRPNAFSWNSLSTLKRKDSCPSVGAALILTGLKAASSGCIPPLLPSLQVTGKAKDPPAKTSYKNCVLLMDAGPNLSALTESSILI